jgi:endonuclease/exonuclease/phosphatase family metal-dependent hydrolase
MKRFLYVSFIVVTWLVSLAYFVSCLTPYINPVHFSILVFFAIGFPFLALSILLIGVVWIFIRKKVPLILLLLFLVGFKNICSTLAFNFSSKSQYQGEENSLRIMSWNVRAFDNPAISGDSPASVRNRMFNYISEVNPDIICIQEFGEFDGPAFYLNTPVLEKMGYKYHCTPKETVTFHPYGVLYSNSAIFSKLAILDSTLIPYNDPTAPENLLCADVQFKGERLRVLSTHFRSMHLFQHVRDPEALVHLHGDSDFVYTASVPEKLTAFEKEHAMQAKIVKDYMNKSKVPIVFAADMNSVPASYAYNVVSAGLQDAFLKKGSGLGGALDSLPRTLRIDYLLVDPKLEIKNYHQQKISLSDHYPHYIDVKWKR